MEQNKRYFKTPENTERGQVALLLTDCVVPSPRVAFRGWVNGYAYATKFQKISIPLSMEGNHWKDPPHPGFSINRGTDTGNFKSFVNISFTWCFFQPPVYSICSSETW